MKRITVGTETTLVVYEDGSGRALQDSGHVSFYSREQGIELANAILAALGEPVEEKPDRSELDRQPQYKYAAIEGGKLLDRWNKDVPLETVIESAKGCTDKNFGVYEMIAFVGPKPSVERKVVRLD